MRLITFILSSGIALTWIPACASAQKVTYYPDGTMKHCPQGEGNVDCNHVQPAPSQRAYGSLWGPSRAQNTAQRPANQNPNRNR
jgi:hypothetical protein